MKSVVSGKVSLALALSSLVLWGCNCNPPPETFDATPPRRDTGFIPFDAGNPDTSVNRDSATATDTATGTDTAVAHDAATGTDTTVAHDAATGTDSATTSDSGSTGNDATTTGDAAVAPGRGEVCTQGSCNAPYTCVIPQGQTEGYCLQACSGVGTCSGRTQACLELDPSIPGTYCLDRVPRGSSCFDVYTVCAVGTDCYVTAEDDQGYPTEALCKQTCDVGGSTCSSGNADAGVAAESCLASGYVDLEYDSSDNPIICDQNPTACTTASGYECMDLRTSDGRTVKACAKSLGWCGAAGGPGDTCDEAQDLYCGDITDPLPSNNQDPAFGICDSVCWYICFIPAQYSSSGADVNLDCPTSMACVAGGPYSDIGVKVCDHGFDAGTPIDAGTTPDSATGADAAMPDAAGTDTAMPDATGTDASTCAPCGNITFVGECNTDVLTWCNPDGCLQSYDCSTDSAGGSPLHCAQFNPTWGFDCLAGAGQPCNPDYPNRPTSPNAPVSPGCDPTAGTCSPTSFVCGPAADGGVVTVDAGTGTDAGQTCLPCTVNAQPVDDMGTCDNDILYWCNPENCLADYDCADDSRHCASGAYSGPPGSFTWYDCMSAVGQSCMTINDYFTRLTSGQSVDFLCDPDTTSGCNAQAGSLGVCTQ
ncbi:MAG: hypothetical protein ABIJ09_24655 [Pseudomonadota bacterium]